MSAMLTMSFRMSSQTDDYTVVPFTVYVLHSADDEGVGSLWLCVNDVLHTVDDEEECNDYPLVA